MRGQSPPPGNRGLGGAETPPQQSQTSSAAAKLKQLIRSEGIPNTYTPCPNHTNALDAGHAAFTEELANKKPTNLRNMITLPLHGQAGTITRTFHIFV